MKKSPGSEELVLQIEMPSGSFRATISVPRAPIRLASLARSAMAIDQELVEMGVRLEQREGRPIACKNGCAACCRQAVALSPPEAFMLAEMVRAMPLARRQQLIPRFIDVDQRLEQTGLKARFQARIETADAARALGLEYLQLGLTCPFLEDESCSIYAERPSACREYLVTSPAAHCAEIGRRAVDRVPVSVRLSESLARVAARVLEKEAEVVPLALALEWADDHAEDDARTFDARALMEHLATELATPPAS